MKDLIARETAEKALTEATDARAKVEKISKQFDEWIPQFEKTATKTIADQLRQQVAPLAVQLREISETLGKLQSRVEGGLKKDEIATVERRVQRVEQALKRMQSALAS